MRAKADHVGLTVAAVDPERMQLHQFTISHCIILVEADHLAVGPATARRAVLRIIEIKEHRRVVCGSEQQVAESPQRVRPDRLFLVGAHPQMIEAFTGKDIEMIVPEVDHDLLQLAMAHRRA